MKMDELAEKHAEETGHCVFYTEDGVHFECSICNPPDDPDEFPRSAY